MPALSRVLTVFLSTGLSEYALILVRVAIASRTESWRFLSVFPEEHAEIKSAAIMIAAMKGALCFIWSLSWDSNPRPAHYE